MKTVTELAFDAQYETITLLLEREAERLELDHLMLSLIEDRGHDDCAACDFIHAVLSDRLGLIEREAA